MDTRQLVITTNNTSQNIGSGEYHQPNAKGNLSLEKPTIEQVNVAIGVTTEPATKEPSELQFGTHIREAAPVLKDGAKSR